MTRLSSARSRASIAIVAAGVLAAFCAASTAEAGTYTARLCAEGFTPAGDKGPFERSGNETVFSLANNCGDFNGLRISHNAGEAGAQDVQAAWLAERPNGIAVRRVAYQASGHRSGGYFPQIVGTLDGQQGLDVINGDAKLTEDFSEANVDGNLRRFGVRLICQTDRSACGANPDGPAARLKDVRYTLADADAPKLELTGGSLFEGEAEAGKRTISFDAADDGSGVRRIVVLANGDRVAGAGAKCDLKGGFALGMKPCPASFDGSITVDTGRLRNGVNSVRVCAEDVGDRDPNTTCAPARNVLVLNGCAGNQGSPAGTGKTLRLGWKGGRNAAPQHRQGRRRTAVAQLFGPSGAPLGGAAVCFSRSIPGRAGTERVLAPGAITNPKGEASVEVRGQSSRIVRATYWVGGVAVLSKKIELSVSPRIRLGLRPSDRIELGESVRAVAILGGKWRAGRKVCFYAERPGRNLIGCDKTGSGGRARLGYEPPEPGKIGFFAKVPNQKGYPYVNGRSKVKHLRVVR